VISRFLIPAYRLWRDHPHLALPVLGAYLLSHVLTQPSVMVIYQGLLGWFLFYALEMLVFGAGIIQSLWVLKTKGLTMVNRWFIALLLAIYYFTTLLISVFPITYRLRFDVLYSPLSSQVPPPFTLPNDVAIIVGLNLLWVGFLLFILAVVAPFCLVMFARGGTFYDVILVCRKRFFYFLWTNIQVSLVSFLLVFPMAIMGELFILFIGYLFPIVSSTLNPLLIGAISSMVGFIQITTAIRVIPDSKIES